MEKLFNIASYVYFRFQKEYGTQIDEMKFHKVMYFAQRESLIQTDKFLFDGTFYGWKYGPVLKEIRELYIKNDFSELDGLACKVTDSFNCIMDKVFSSYVPKESWTLSMLSHNELSWKNSRIGIPENANGDKPIDNDDIRKDAERMRFRREILNVMKQA